MTKPLGILLLTQYSKTRNAFQIFKFPLLVLTIYLSCCKTNASISCPVVEAVQKATELIRTSVKQPYTQVCNDSIDLSRLLQARQSIVNCYFTLSILLPIVETAIDFSDSCLCGLKLISFCRLTVQLNKLKQMMCLTLVIYVLLIMDICSRIVH